jgi:2-phospho-L-lactate guanylyltransferase
VTDDRQTAQYGAVVPVKPLAVAKSRLTSVGEDTRRELVRAFVTDTVSALLDCPSVGLVLVVTDEVALAAGLRELGALTIPDGMSEDLNGTLVQGAAEVCRRSPALRPLALCGDLPSLRSRDLAEVLARMPTERAAFVCDASGTGTTLYTAPSLEGFAPRFGLRSRQAHLDAGAVEVAAPPSVRRDVDTIDDLRDALDLGVGRSTSWVVTVRGLADRP